MRRASQCRFLGGDGISAFGKKSSAEHVSCDKHRLEAKNLPLCKQKQESMPHMLQTYHGHPSEVEAAGRSR